LLLFELEGIGLVELCTILLIEINFALLPVAEGDVSAIVRASIWVTFHIHSDFAFLLECLGWHKESQLVLIVVSLESQLDLLVLRVFIKVCLNLFEDGERSSKFVNSSHTQFIVFELDFGPPIYLEGWNWHVEFFHDLGHDGLDPCMDDELRKVVDWSFLEVDGNQFSAVPCHVNWNLIGWSNSQTATERKHEISLYT